MNEGYVMLQRSRQTQELIKDPKAFALLTLIACRAKRTDDLNVHGLKPGQALIGDCASHGLTAKEYRNAKARLKRYGLVDFRPTNKGTIATLLDASVYDINVQQRGQTSGKQRTGKGQPEGNPEATDKKDKADGLDEPPDEVLPHRARARPRSLRLDHAGRRKPATP